MARQPLQTVDLKELCETLLEAHLDAATVKSIDLGLDVQSVHVSGHAWLLRELLGNLSDNALQYTPAGGTVTLRCGRAPDNGAAFLEVEDDGPGVPLEERQRVLARFYRLPGTVSQGNGLGFAILDEIARVHHVYSTWAARREGAVPVSPWYFRPDPHPRKNPR